MISRTTGRSSAIRVGTAEGCEDTALQTRACRKLTLVKIDVADQFKLDVYHRFTSIVMNSAQ